MIGFLVFLLVVFVAGFIYLTFESNFKKTKITIPQASEVSMGFGNDLIEEVPLLPKVAPRVNQVHMERRMFERPRRKVKR